MGMLYSGKVETMMPKLHSQNFEGMELIRPMYLIKESAIKAWRDTNGLHFIQCACRFTENCVSSVSYTHLDVYKRQPLSYRFLMDDHSGPCNGICSESYKIRSLYDRDRFQ